MPTPADRLAALAAVSIGDATRALLAGGSVAAWERAMREAITRAQTAAFIAATAQRLGIPADSPLISRQRLSRAERADVERAVRAQLDYLTRFVAEVRAGRLSPAQTAARALLYAGSVKAPYYAARWADWDIPARLLPGMQQCVGNCLCSGAVVDHGDGTGVWRRVLVAGDAERHCGECPQLEGDHPIKRHDSAVKHGTHDQSSHGRRRGGGGGGGSSRVRAGAEPADVSRRLQSIDAELASRFTSPGRREQLERQRRELAQTQQTPAPPAAIAQSTVSAADRERRLRDIDAELAGRYVSGARRQELEARRAALLQQGAPAPSTVVPPSRPMPPTSPPPPAAPSPQPTPKAPPGGRKAEIDAVEDQIRGMRVERAVFFGPNGEHLADVMGKTKSFELPKKDFDNLREIGKRGPTVTMTHNHPQGWDHSPSDPRHRGDSFSLADIRQAAALNLAEVRAVTPTRRFWMKAPPGGWKDHHWQATIPKAYKRHYDAVLAELVQKVRSKELTVEEGAVRHYHEVWRRVAREVNASYGYEDR